MQKSKNKTYGRKTNYDTIILLFIYIPAIVHHIHNMMLLWMASERETAREVVFSTTFSKNKVILTNSNVFTLSFKLSKLFMF